MGILGTFLEYLESDDISTRCLLATGSALLFTAFDYAVVRGPIGKRISEFFKVRNPKATPKELKEIVDGCGPRVSVFLHNAAVFVLAPLVLSTAAHQSDPIYHVSTASNLLGLVSTGYFLYDAWSSLRDVQREGWAYVFHGWGCLSLYLYGYMSRRCHYYLAGYVLWELSTPFVQLRWLLWNMGLGSGTLYIVNGLMMAVVFFFVRIVWGYYLSYKYFRQSVELLAAPDFPGSFPKSLVWFYRLAAIALNSLNTYWFYLMSSKIISYVMRMGPKKAGSSNKKASAAGAPHGLEEEDAIGLTVPSPRHKD